MTLIKKPFSLPSVALFLSVAVSMVSAQTARADFSCRDYYTDYINEATEPAPVIIVVGSHPHYHDHYPVYHDGYHGHDGDDEAIIGLAILAGLLTTTAVQDAELQSAIDMRNIIDEAQLGDGASLQNLVMKVQKYAHNNLITEAQVARVINYDNATLAFCVGGDLKNEDELAALIAGQLQAYR